jgi:hypothetical protein
MNPYRGMNPKQLKLEYIKMLSNDDFWDILLGYMYLNTENKQILTSELKEEFKRRLK